jgi:hypothetical protein
MQPRQACTAVRLSPRTVSLIRFDNFGGANQEDAFIMRRFSSACPAALLLVLLLVSVHPVFAQPLLNDPFLGHHHYPQFRNLSGLSGGGYGVDASGYPSLSGATALSTPVAPTMGRDTFRIVGGKMTYNRVLELSNKQSNGSLEFAYGHTFGSFNVMVSDMFISSAQDNAINAQIQYIPRGDAKWVPAVGIQDVFGTGGSAGQGLPTDGDSSQSIYGVLTYRLDTRFHPLYISWGFGSHRFSQTFASGSLQLFRPLRGFLEYDGFGFNGGFLLTLKTSNHRKAPEFTANFAIVRGHYFYFGGGLGF